LAILPTGQDLTYMYTNTCLD